MNRPVYFLMLLLFWVLLTWPAEVPGLPYLQDLGVGIAVAALVAWLLGEPGRSASARWLEPARYVWALAYLVVLAGYIVRANLDVAYRVLHPAMPIDPGLVQVKTRLRHPVARTVLGNSVTLTPGTLTVDLDAQGLLTIHWICVRSRDPEEAARMIIGRFEGFLEKIFEERTG